MKQLLINQTSLSGILRLFAVIIVATLLPQNISATEYNEILTCDFTDQRSGSNDNGIYADDSYSSIAWKCNPTLYCNTDYNTYNSIWYTGLQNKDGEDVTITSSFKMWGTITSISVDARCYIGGEPGTPIQMTATISTASNPTPVPLDVNTVYNYTNNQEEYTFSKSGLNYRMNGDNLIITITTPKNESNIYYYFRLNSITIEHTYNSLSLNKTSYEALVGEDIGKAGIIDNPDNFPLQYYHQLSRPEHIYTLEELTGNPHSDAYPVYFRADPNLVIKDIGLYPSLDPFGDDSHFSLTVTKTKYDLWINDIQVSDNNKGDILGDSVAGQRPASFIYNPKNNNLIVSTSITSQVDYNVKSGINGGLTIYQTPKNQSWISSIKYTGTGDAPLTITTDGNNPGMLFIGKYGQTPEQIAIEGFSELIPDKRQNLAAINISGEIVTYQNRQLSGLVFIATTLNPLVRETHITPDETTLEPNEGEDFVNTIDGQEVLYTLDKVSSPTGDGYDNTEKCVVINTITSDEQAADAENYCPGTMEFFNILKGITYVVPAGNGTVGVEFQTEEGYALKMKFGDAEPVVLQKPVRGEMAVRYNVGKPTRVYLYASKTGANARSIEKGGKKTLASTKIYGSSVKPSTVKSSNPVGPASDYYYTGDTSGMAGQTVMSDEMMAAAMGDVDGNGVKNAKDIMEIVKAMMGKHSPEYDETMADMNDDGVINTADIEIVVTQIP